MHDNLMETLRALIGPDAVLDAAEVAQRSAGAMRQDHLVAQALVRPRNTDELASVMRLCHAQGISVVTQGGLTGLVHGADAAPESVIVSMERMRTIEDINPRERTATVQAGVVLQALQEAVDPLGLIFPLDLGARGSATLGGNAATNAGGNRVIRYGMMRDMVLGLEVVLADGTVLSSMNRLIKNNTGYDLKQLFIGAEGTLGLICAATLRLRAPARLVSAAAPCCLHTGTAFPRLGVTVARRASRAVPASPWADPGLGLLWFLWRVHLSRQQCICAGSSIRARWPVVSAAWSAYLCGSLLG